MAGADEYSGLPPVRLGQFKSDGSGNSRISVFNLVAIAAIGGWPGGLLAMPLFRHKTAKVCSKLKYVLVLLSAA